MKLRQGVERDVRIDAHPRRALRIEALKQTLKPARDPAGDEVKAELKRNTDDAIARGVFGVPSYAVDDKLFWGLDVLPMLRAYLEGDPWFSAGAWDGASGVPLGISRVASR